MYKETAFKDDFARNKTGLIIAIVIFLLATFLICRKELGLRYKKPIAYSVCLVHTLAVSYIAGFISINYNTTFVLASFITTFGITMGLSFLAGKIVNNFLDKKGKMRSLGQTFFLLGAIVVTVSIIYLAKEESKETKGKNYVFLGAALVAVLLYMLVDTYAIVAGKYDNTICKDDYIYGATKLYVDFVLCFALLLSLGGGDGGA